MSAVKKLPETPRECSICNRVERALKSNPELKERLSEDDIAAVINTAQNAILNKEDITHKGEIKMSDEKYVISKASFEDFYEIQDNLVSVIEKMVGRIEKQDQVIMKFGAALTELIAKAEAMEFPFQDEEPVADEEEEELVEEEVEEDEDVESEDVEGEEAVDEEDDEEAVADDEIGEDELDELIGKAQKEAFEAGWKAHSIEMKKQMGIEVKPLEMENSGARPVPSADVQSAQAVGQIKKTLSDDDLAKMSPQQLNSWLKEQGF